METRLTLRPGQPGTRKLVEKYGERLVCVHYVYDAASGRRLKTVELVVESVTWNPKGRKRRRQDDDVVYVRIAYHETELRERAKRLGAMWRQPQRLWEITFRDSKRLGIEDRIVDGG
jgi:serine kinase of HPr protein (carbohydrate metabolism regulator)